jgi:hypothetical protein
MNLSIKPNCSYCDYIDGEEKPCCFDCCLWEPPEENDTQCREKEWLLPDDRFVIMLDGCVERCSSVFIGPRGEPMAIWTMDGDWINGCDVALYVTGEPIEFDFIEAFGIHAGEACYTEYLNESDRGGKNG